MRKLTNGQLTVFYGKELKFALDRIIPSEVNKRAALEKILKRFTKATRLHRQHFINYFEGTYGIKLLEK